MVLSGLQIALKYHEKSTTGQWLMHQDLQNEWPGTAPMPVRPQRRDQGWLSKRVASMQREANIP